MGIFDHPEEHVCSQTLVLDENACEAEGWGWGAGGRLAVPADSSHLIPVGRRGLGERVATGTEKTTSDWKAAPSRNGKLNKHQQQSCVSVVPALGTGGVTAWCAVPPLLHPKAVLLGWGQDSSSSTTNSLVHVFNDLFCVLGCRHVGTRRAHPQTGSTNLSKMSWCAEAQRVPLTGSKAARPTA